MRVRSIEKIGRSDIAMAQSSRSGPDRPAPR